MALSTVDGIYHNSNNTFLKGNTAKAQEVNINRNINIVGHVIEPYIWQSITELNNKIMVRLGTNTQNEIHVSCFGTWKK